jgi:hypothetical protein
MCKSMYENWLRSMGVAVAPGCDDRRRCFGGCTTSDVGGVDEVSFSALLGGEIEYDNGQARRLAGSLALCRKCWEYAVDQTLRSAPDRRTMARTCMLAFCNTGHSSPSHQDAIADGPECKQRIRG